MKKVILGVVMTLTSLMSFGQSIGFTGNYSSNGASYGLFVEPTSNFGIEYQHGATLNLDMTEATRYINGEISSYTAGSEYFNVGAYAIIDEFKNGPKVLFGGGLQLYEEITTNGNVNGFNPYVHIGLKVDVEEQINLRFGGQLTQGDTGINQFVFGIGFNL